MFGLIHIILDYLQKVCTHRKGVQPLIRFWHKPPQHFLWKESDANPDNFDNQRRLAPSLYQQGVVDRSLPLIWPGHPDRCRFEPAAL